jgi:hypothetical protein
MRTESFYYIQPSNIIDFDFDSHDRLERACRHLVIYYLISTVVSKVSMTMGFFFPAGNGGKVLSSFY